MKKINICLILILVLSIGINIGMFFQMRNKSQEHLNEVLENANTIYECNVKIDSLENEIKQLKENQIEKQEESSNNKITLEYYEENNSLYTEIDTTSKVKLISIDKACDIADKEAKKEMYQYQSWKSEFYSRDKENDTLPSIRLLNGIKDTNNISWEDDWKKVDDYNQRIIWKIRLFDKVDPLTSLYIYIDAENGEVIGAGKLSD